MNASPGNYLSEIDINKVVEVLFQLTNPKNLAQKKRSNNHIQRQSSNICHENIVKSICLEILKDDNAFKAKTYLRVLQMADLSQADYVSLKDIYQLAQDINDHIEDKLIQKSAKKFSETIFGLMSKKPEYAADKQKKSSEQENTLINNDANTTQMNGTAPVNNGDSTINATKDLEHKSLIKNRRESKEDIIDYDFKKLKKKAAGNKSTAMNSTMNKTLLKTDPLVMGTRIEDQSTVICDANETIVPKTSRNRTSLNMSRSILKKSKITINKINNARKSIQNKSNNIELKDCSIVLEKLDSSKIEEINSKSKKTIKEAECSKNLNKSSVKNSFIESIIASKFGNSKQLDESDDNSDSSKDSFLIDDSKNEPNENKVTVLTKKTSTRRSLREKKSPVKKTLASKAMATRKSRRDQRSLGIASQEDEPPKKMSRQASRADSAKSAVSVEV